MHTCGFEIGPHFRNTIYRGDGRSSERLHVAIGLRHLRSAARGQLVEGAKTKVDDGAGLHLRAERDDEAEAEGGHRSARAMTAAAMIIMI